MKGHRGGTLRGSTAGDTGVGSGEGISTIGYTAVGPSRGPGKAGDTDVVAFGRGHRPQ